MLCLSVPIIWLDKIGHVFGFLVTMMVMMWVIGWSNVIHFVYASALVASFVWSRSRYLYRLTSAMTLDSPSQRNPEIADFYIPHTI